MTIATSISQPYRRAIAQNLIVPDLSGSVPSPSFVKQSLLAAAPTTGGLLLGGEPGRGTQRDMQPGRCYDFDGINDYIDYGSIGSVHSYSLWVEPDSITSTTDYVLDLNGTDYLTIVTVPLTMVK